MRAFIFLLSLISLPVHSLDFSAFGAVCNSLTDASGPWAQAMATANAGQDKQVRMPANCRYAFTQQPAPIPAGVTVIGQGPSTSGLEARFSNGLLIDLRGTGAQLHGVYLWAPKGFQNNVGLLIQPRTGQPGGAGYEIVRDVVITSGDGGDWLVPLYVDGQFNTLNGRPFGARAVQLDNVRAFGGTYACAILWDAPDLQWLSGNCHRGTGLGVVRGGYDAANLKLAPWIK